MLKSAGPLVIIGGAEDKNRDCTILREFVRLAGGDDARIVVMTVATQHPREVGREYTEVFERILGKQGSGQVQCLDIMNRAEANAKAGADLIQQATGVFFTGGDQVRITNLLGGTRVDTVLHEKHEQGLVLAGTSAGASMMSSVMILGGASETLPRLGMVRLGAGLEFLSGVIIDQHFAERGRILRLISAATQYPHYLGIGIDEDTALIVQGHEFSVVGSGGVTIVDTGNVTNLNINEVGEDDFLALCNVQIHLLPSGHRFDIRGRAPVITSKESHVNELSLVI